MLPERKPIPLPETDHSQKIQDLDPLRIDGFMIHQLPLYNNSNSPQAIIEALPTFIPNEETINNFDINESRASMRDLGMIAASLQRHGISISSLPNLENTLIVLGNKTGEVPRETVFHYGPWNPTGERTRTFTGTEGEKLFIDSFREGMSGLDSCIKSLIQAQATSLGPDFARLLNDSKDQFERMVKAMVEIRRKITPQFFTENLRPYFPVLNIGGNDYLAPGGAQMPVLLVDRVLWGTDETNPEYQSYYVDNQAYLPTEYKIDSYINRESVVSKFVREANESDHETFTSREALKNLFTSLLSFRYPHLQTAKENFALRKDGAKGSGGYQPIILETLVNLTRQARDRI